MYAWILRSFKALSLEDSNERFEDSDADEDGWVTWSEYYEEEYDFGDMEDPDLTDPATAEEFKMMEEDKFLFDSADRDKDGKLSQKEYFAFTHPEEDPDMKPHVLATVIDLKIFLLRHNKRFETCFLNNIFSKYHVALEIVMYAEIFCRF